MKSFKTFSGIAAPLIRVNIDTDAIIPSREIKTVSKKGLSGGLFAEWRYLSLESRKEDPDFILNQDPFKKASILVTGNNFGCGSSREHAVWALGEWGIRAIIAPSYGSIFYSNCIKNGILPIVMDGRVISSMSEYIKDNPEENRLTVNLIKNEVSYSNEVTETFVIQKQDKEFLINGLDQIEQTLQKNSIISEFETLHKKTNPWLDIS
jgi:3-isopropylmalate/(R)-2-methylmalate dehydratase small subunit